MVAESRAAACTPASSALRVGLYRAVQEESADGADGQLCKAREGTSGPGVQALEQRARPAHLREHFSGCVEDVAGALQDDHERVPTGGRGGAGQTGLVCPREEGLLWRRR